MLDRAEAEIKALKIEFDRFFNGALPMPPEAQRLAVGRRLKGLRDLRTTADRFRLNSLEGRFNTLSELWQRRVRDAERAAEASSAAPPAVRARRFDPFSGIQLQGAGNRDAVESLYTELYRSSGRAKKIDFQSFQEYLDKQIDRLRSKTGCSQVQFRIATEDGEPKLKARPIGPQKSTSSGSGGAE